MERILVVDDEREVADLLELYLANEGYRVFKFYGGKEAYECVEREEIDLALLDVMLPDVDGFKLCQMIRKEHYFPIIMLTARVEDVDKIKACGFTRREGAGGAPYFEQAQVVLVCRKLYWQDLDPTHFLDSAIDGAHYPNHDYHRMFIGEIVEVLVQA